MRFADIPGHDDVKRRLREMADSGNIPHALLLEGRPGAAKFALVRAMAQYIHCTDHTPDGDSCGRCPACLQHQKFNHIDTFFTFPYLKKGSRTTLSEDYLPEWRQFLHDSPYMDFELWLSMLGNANGQPQIFVDEAAALSDRLTRTPRQSKYKIVLLWLPERLQESAANKLLKLIEEPYSDTLFLMSSNSPREILPTIYSRTQRIDVTRYSDSEIAAILSGRHAVATEEAEAVAPLADGDITKALRLVSPDKTKAVYLDLFIRLMRLAYTRKVGELRKWSVEVAALGREGSMRFYDYCAHLVRENFILNIGDLNLVSMAPDELEFSRRFSPFINVVNVERIFDTLTAARNDTGLNANGKIVAFDLAVKMILLIKQGQE